MEYWGLVITCGSTSPSIGNGISHAFSIGPYPSISPSYRPSDYPCPNGARSLGLDCSMASDGSATIASVPSPSNGRLSFKPSSPLFSSPFLCQLGPGCPSISGLRDPSYLPYSCCLESWCLKGSCLGWWSAGLCSWCLMVYWCLEGSCLDSCYDVRRSLVGVDSSLRWLTSLAFSF